MKTTQAAFFKIWWIVVFFGHFVGLSAQHEGYHFSHLTETDGLSSHHATSIAEDKKSGFLWFGSCYALQRYDGEEFVKVFPKKRDQHNRSTQTVPATIWLFDTKGNIWFWDDAANIVRFSTQTHAVDTIYSLKNAADSLIHFFPGFYSSSMFEDSKGRIWMNSESGLLQFDPVKRGFKPARIKTPRKMRSIGRIVEDKEGWFWLCMEDKPCRYNPETGELIYAGNNPDRNPLFDVGAQTVFMDLKDNLWWGGWGPAIKYSLKTGKIETTLPQVKALMCMAEDGAGRLWMACYYLQGIFCLEATTGKITQYEEEHWKPDGLRVGDWVNQLHLDSKGILWVIGTNYISSFQPDNQSFFLFKNGPGDPNTVFPNREINDFYQRPDGSAMITYWSEDCPVLLMDRHFTIQKKFGKGFQSLFPDACGWKIIEDKEHQIWITQQDGLATIYDPIRKTVRKLQPPELKGTAVEHVMRDRRGDLWFGLWNGHGLAHWDYQARKFQHFDISKSVFQGIVLCIVEDPHAERLWLATDHGLIRFDKDGGDLLHFQINQVNKRDATNNLYDKVESMVLYQDSLLFLGHSSGLFRFNMHTLEARIIKPRGLEEWPPPNRGMLLDAKNRIWYSCTSGLVRYDPASNEAMVFKFDKVLEGQVPANLSYNKLRDGRFFISFGSRFISFDPLQLPEKIALPTPVITRFQTLGDHPRNLLSIDSNRVLKFQHDENYFTVHFSCFEFFEKIARFSWRLKGLSDSWSEPSKLALANFTNVPPGNHTFEVKAISDDGLESPVTRFQIHIKPPYWATWWFRLLGLTAIGGLFYAIFRYREIQRLRQEQLRLRIARDLHDEVGSTLSAISILSASTLHGVQKDLDAARFGNIGDKARAALDSISDIVWSVNPENDSMEKALARMSAYASEMLENVGAELRFEVGEGVEALTLPMEKRKNFYLIFKEAVHNCAKYAKAKRVEVALKKEGNTLIMSVKDDGEGFEMPNSETKNLGGNGLRNMRSRAAAMGGSLELVSALGGGTEVRLVLPV